MGAAVIVTATSVTLTAATVGATSAVVAAADAGSGVDFWTLAEKGGAPMAFVLLIAFFGLLIRYDKALGTIEQKNATILAMAERHVVAAEAATVVAKSQMEVAIRTEKLLGQLVALWRGKPVGVE